MDFKTVHKDTHIQIDSNGTEAKMIFFGSDVPADLYETYTRFKCTSMVVGRGATSAITTFLASHPGIVDVAFLKTTGLEAEIEKLSHLQALYLVIAKGKVLDLQNLAQLRSLKVIYIEAAKQLPSLPPNLTELSVSSFPEPNLSSIGHLHKLKVLDITQGKLEDIEDIRNLTELETVHLAYLKKLHSIEGLSSLKKLTELELHNLPSVTRADSLAQNHNLKRLVIDRVSIDEDISWLANLRNLEHLNLNIQQVKSLAPLLNTNLRKLFLDDTWVMDNDLLGIAKKDLAIFGFMPKKSYNFKSELDSSTGELIEYWPDGRTVKKQWDSTAQAYVRTGGRTNQ